MHVLTVTKADTMTEGLFRESQDSAFKKINIMTYDAETWFSAAFLLAEDSYGKTGIIFYKVNIGLNIIVTF